MRKKVVSILLGICLALGMIACGNEVTPSNGNDVAREESGGVGVLPEDESMSAPDVAGTTQDAEAGEDAPASSEAEAETDQATDTDVENTTELSEQPSSSADEEPEVQTDKEPADEVDDQREDETAEEETMVYEVVYEIPEGFDRMHDDVKYAKISEVYYSSKTVGKARKCNVIVPADYSEDKEYPVLYLLHGIGGDHKEWLGGAPIQIFTNLVEEGLTEDMIIVIPNVRARTNDAGNPSDIYTLEHYKAFDNFINDLRDDLMPYIEENYSVKTGKENTAIAGLSMGGREALYIGFSMPETFGYIGAFEPAPGLLKYTNFGVSEDGLFAPEDFVLPEDADNFVLIVKGNQDEVVREFPLEYHNTLEDNGVEHVYYEIDGGHDFTVWKHGLYNFMRAVFKNIE